MTKEHIAASYYSTRSVSDVLFMLENAERELHYAKHQLENYEATLEFRRKTYGSGGEMIDRVIEANKSIAVLSEKIITLKWVLNMNTHQDKSNTINGNKSFGPSAGKSY